MTVLVLVGLPGSGKSTWAAAQPITVLSSDTIRQLLAGDATNQQIHQEVFRTLRFLLRRRLELGAPATIIDATSLLPVHRKPFIKIAHSLGAHAEAVYFDTPLAECLRSIVVMTGLIAEGFSNPAPCQSCTNVSPMVCVDFT